MIGAGAGRRRAYHFPSAPYLQECRRAATSPGCRRAARTPVVQPRVGFHVASVHSIEVLIGSRRPHVAGRAFAVDLLVVGARAIADGLDLLQHAFEYRRLVVG